MNRNAPNLGFALGIVVLLAPACGGSTSSAGAAGLVPQVVEFEDSSVNLLSIGPLTHKFSLGPPESETISECYTHLSESMEQILCWTKTEPGFEPNLEGAFTNVVRSDFEENFLTSGDYFSSPRTVSGFQAIEFESYGRRRSQPTTIRSLMWATSGNVWHVTFYFVMGNPHGEATVESVFDSVELKGEASPVEIYGGVPEQPAPMPRGVERLLIRVTADGEIYLNGNEASVVTAGQELMRLGKVNGVVLYDRAGGDSPPPEAERVSARLLFAAGMAGVEIFWIGG